MDYSKKILIVGSGLMGLTISDLLKRNDDSIHITMVEKSDYVGGACVDYYDTDINCYVHKFGPHIFHTSNKSVWNYLNEFCEFNNFVNSPIALFGNQVYNLPFNMNTFCKLFNLSSIEEVKKRIQDEINEYIEFDDEPDKETFESVAIKRVGISIYEKLIKGYTMKQWGVKDVSSLNPDIIKRVPLRFTFDNNYFNDIYQGIPKLGYNSIFSRMIGSVDYLLKDNYSINNQVTEDDSCTFDYIIYTGRLDELFNFNLGILDFRCLDFHEEVISGNIDKTKYDQGNAVINYASLSVPYTRSTDYRYFYDRNPYKDGTEDEVIKKYYEKPVKDTKRLINSFYPLDNEENKQMYGKYCEKVKEYFPNMILAGRSAEMRYLDMSPTIELASSVVKSILGYEEIINY